MSEDTTTATESAPTNESASTGLEQAAAPTSGLESAPTSISSAISPDGQLGDGWFLALGDEYATKEKDLGKHKHLRSLVAELEYNRKNSVGYPGDGADEQAIARFRSVAGVPDNPADYGLNSEALGLPAEVAFDQELAEAVTTAAHASHAPPAAVLAMAKAFQEVYGKRVAEAQASLEKERAEARNQLVSEWRGDFETNAATVRHLSSTLLEQSGIPADDPHAYQLFNNPAFAKVMLTVSKLTSEDHIARPTGFGDLRSPDQKIADIKAGNDPHWSPMWQSKSEADRLKVYEHIKTLRDRAAAV